MAKEKSVVELLFNKENLIKTVDNVKYYYGKSASINYNGSNGLAENIYKVTFTSDELFTCERISVEKYSNQYVVTADNIYFYDNTDVFSINIETGDKTNLVSNYVFRGISTDNLGNVIFTAFDENMDNVNGIIYNEGNIEILKSARKYEVYYLTAIN